MATTPTMTMTMEITIATIGLSMKNLAMALPFFWFWLDRCFCFWFLGPFRLCLSLLSHLGFCLRLRFERFRTHNHPLFDLLDTLCHNLVSCL